MSRRSSRKTLRQKNRAILNVEMLEDRLTPSTNTISGFVYYDANNNGVFDSSETPIANSQIQLFNNTTNQIAGTTTTAADGSYSFTTDNSVAGPEQNTAAQSITLGPTLTNFQDAGALPQFNPSLGTLDKVVITESGTILSNIQAENTSPVADTIQGTVSGNFSLSAPGVSNNLLTVTGQTNSFSAAANPSADHSFTGPASVTWDNVSATSATPNTITITDPTILANDYTGTGTVAVTDSANATSSASDTTGNITTNIVSNGEATISVTYYYHTAGSIQTGDTYTVEQLAVPLSYIPGLNSKDGTILPYNPTPPEEITNIVVTAQNPVAPNNNFGELKTTSIAGIAYLQTTPNQTYLQGTTPPLGGVTMTLTGGNLTTPLTTTTASDGTYSFSGLQPGTYTVTQTQPTAYQPGTITAGTDGGTVSPETISLVTLNAGDSATGYNFGELNQPSLSGYVYYEPNAPTQTLYQNNTATPGIGSVTVTLTGSDGSSQTTTTAADGSYSFNQLTSGVTYSVAISHPTGYLVGTDTAGSAGGTVSTASEEVSAVTLTGGAVATGYNFGEVKASSLAGNVYVDAQNDGQLDPGDAPIAHDTITLTGFNDQGPVSETTTTASDGSYSFANLRPGTYGITQTQPSGYIQGATTVGSQGGTETPGDIANISLAPGVNGINNNFGELRPSTPGNPLPKNVLPYGIIPGISKAQMTSDPSWANINPALVSQMSQVVATTMTLTGQQLDLNGVAAGVQTLNAVGVGGYIAQVWNSNAHLAAEVTSAYETVFDRVPTAAELSAGISQLSSGASSTALLETLYTSPAFQSQYSTSAALAAALYQGILNTTPGTVASSSLVQSLTAQPLSEVVQNLMTSTPALENQIDNAYLLVLRRNPSAYESQYWLSQLQSGALTIDQLTQQLLSSQEFSALADANVA